MSKFKVISLFSGVGGFDLGLERAGMEVVAQCELDPFRRKILKRHWPHIPQEEDVSEFSGEGREANLLVGGFPCQDLSVAGRRAGMADGTRSGLFWEFCRIADEVVKPGGWLLIENVPGLLSSHDGDDFRYLLGALSEVGFHDVAWRILDSRYFGVPQRRRRVFILARRASGDRARQVLLEPEGSSRNPEAGEEAGTEASRKAAQGTGTSGGALLARGLTKRYGKGTDSDATDTMVVASALDRQAGGADDNSAQANHLVAVGHGVSASDPDVAGTLGKTGEGGGGYGLDRNGAFVTADVHPTLRTNNRNNSNPATEQDMLIARELHGHFPHTKDVVAVDPRNMTADDTAKTLLGGATKENGGSPSLNDASIIVRTTGALHEEEPQTTSRCLTAHERWDLDTETFIGPAEREAAGWNHQAGGSLMPINHRDGVAPTLQSNQGAALDIADAKAVWENQQAHVWETDYTNPMSTGGGKAGQGYALAHVTDTDQVHYVRRLSPTECERLQGFPDGWTYPDGESLADDLSWYEKEPIEIARKLDEGKPDGRRFAAMGDAVTVPVLHWIGARILEHGEDLAASYPVTVPR